MKKEITLRNERHGTQATAKAEITTAGNYRLTKAQCKRLRAELCGLKGCLCSGNTGARGEVTDSDGMPLDIFGYSDGSAELYPAKYVDCEERSVLH